MTTALQRLVRAVPVRALLAYSLRDTPRLLRFSM